MLKRLKFVVALNSECCLWYDGKRGRRGDSKYATFESNRIESGRPIRIRIESGSFASPYQRATYAAYEPVFLAVTET